ncbi:MAG: thiamine pyrophosphate-dependent dehydrogenase E1 component subunit alpha [Gemmatimonadota bacterium]
MLEIRKFEERVWDVYTRGLMPGLAHLYIGEEGVAVGTCAALREDDYITSTHRGHGHCLAKGARLDRMMAEIMGKESGYCRGKGGSMHIADLSGGNLGANGIVGGSFAIATGAAFSAMMRRSGQVSVCFFGDGAANQGLFMEAANLAAIWSLPVIYLCENNQYGEHTPFAAVTGVERIADRAAGFRLPATQVDGADVLAVKEVVGQAVSLAREGGGPTLVEAITYRFRGHHVGDAAPYRTREELDWWMANKDPIRKLGDFMVRRRAATKAQLEAAEAQVEAAVDAAVEFGRQAPYPSPEALEEDLYA